MFRLPHVRANAHLARVTAWSYTAGKYTKCVRIMICHRVVLT